MSGERDARTIHVLVVDDHAVIRKGLRALLATEPDLKVVGEARDGREAIEQVAGLRPDVVLMDLVMPGVGGLEAIRHITAEQPQVRILVLTSFGGVEKISPAIEAGALGYLLKDSSPEELVEAIRQACWGDASLHPVSASKLPEGPGQPEKPAT